MDSNSNISRKDIRDALVRAALKDEAFRESLLANPKFAVERALGTTLPDRLKVVLLQETDDLMYIVLPKDFPDQNANLSDAELETIAGGFLNAENNTFLGPDSSL
jgi:hypothetical protein